MKSTCHSEYGAIESIFLKNIETAWISQEKVDQEWEDLFFVEQPFIDLAKTEYAKFQDIILENAESVSFFEESGTLSLDSIYCRDASFATDHGMIICNMGKPNRIPEPESQMKAFMAEGIPILGKIVSPGCVEGGDMLWIDEKTIAIGRSYRTNEEGISQVRHLVEPFGIEVTQVDLPHFRGSSDIFHLMSIISPLDKDLALISSPYMPITFRNLLIERGYELIENPFKEFDSQGCNVLALAPRKVLAEVGNPITHHRMREAGVEVIDYPGNEISAKGGGGPTCLTRPIRRRVDS